jgi:hypothetical protein
LELSLKGLSYQELCYRDGWYRPCVKPPESILDPIRLEAKDLLEEVKEEAFMKDSKTIHEVSFKDNHAHSRPIYDYTTGTSN